MPLTQGTFDSPNWPTCTEDGCIGIQVTEQSQRCLEHLAPDTSGTHRQSRPIEIGAHLWPTAKAASRSEQGLTAKLTANQLDSRRSAGISVDEYESSTCIHGLQRTTLNGAGKS